MTTERRAQPRFLLNTPVRVEFGNTIQRYQAINISGGGVYLECPKPLPVGSALIVQFEIAGAGKVKAHGQVCHRNPILVADAGQPERTLIGMGIMFTRIEGDGAQRLIEFIKSLTTPAP